MNDAKKLVEKWKPLLEEFQNDEEKEELAATFLENIDKKIRENFGKKEWRKLIQRHVLTTRRIIGLIFEDKKHYKLLLRKRKLEKILETKGDYNPQKMSLKKYNRDITEDLQYYMSGLDLEEEVLDLIAHLIYEKLQKNNFKNVWNNTMIYDIIDKDTIII